MSQASPPASPPIVDPSDKSMDELVALCKRRGFVFPASEIYGGLNGFWDYGPLGVALKNHIRDWWWRCMVECPPLGPKTLNGGDPVHIVGLDSAIIQNPRTWEASGHVGGFNDPMVDCTQTKKRYRADHLICLARDAQDAGPVFCYVENDEQSEAAAKKKLNKHFKRELEESELCRAPLMQMRAEAYPSICGPDASKPGTLTEPRQFNLMFETYVGAIRNEDAKAYLRPETAQGIFLNFKNIVDTMRVKMPFGIAQIGKSFRNEVTPRNFIFRSREFEQMEMEWFCPPDDALGWYEFWKQQRLDWWKTLGVSERNLILREHESDELAHYSRACVDVEYRYPFTSPGFGELEGVAHRGCFDLEQHQAHSGVRLDYFDQELQTRLSQEGLEKDQIKQRSRYVPNVIEPASGLTRAVLVLLCEAYTPDATRPSGVVMRFKPKFAPIKAGVFPLVNKDGMPEMAHKLYEELRHQFAVQYDAKQAIGKRYARMDEAGTPYCFTVDGDSLSDGTVTVRDRDTQSQARLPAEKVGAFLAEKIEP